MKRTPSFVMTEQELPFKHSKWLVGSSLCFLVPASFGFYQGRVALPCLYSLTSFVSVNYWRKAVYGTRRNADLLVSRFTAVCWLVSESDRRKPRHVLNLFMCVTAASFYRLSFYLHEKHARPWIQAHILMHFVCATAMFLGVCNY